MNKQDLKISDKCFECEIFWMNNDTETECEGAKEPCHEFRQRKYLKEGAVKDDF